ncbi:glycoside hydrolase family 104 protein [Stenotrophomonas sp. DR822]|uniref:glycoside hydrolase family 24 protein n=1 Tax=Stenotrophomonas sp. DR822 TaxID=2871174 RepID=UPI001C973AE7|nr:glycoside hydrolase family 104 protein [Stenotrophomonas sp. DR822]QZN80317.1 glycoside hydrolase family 104 protein [Stenotrophomonas sp. DR822]
MLAWFEETYNGRKSTKNHGNDVLVGGVLFTDLSKHPVKLVRPTQKLASTAVGSYQFLSRTWGVLQKQQGLPNFSPLSQDKACIELIRGRRALDSVEAGEFDRAVAWCSKEPASRTRPGAPAGLPRSPARQPRSTWPMGPLQLVCPRCRWRLGS